MEEEDEAAHGHVLRVNSGHEVLGNHVNKLVPTVHCSKKYVRDFSQISDIGTGLDVWFANDPILISDEVLG